MVNGLALEPQGVRNATITVSTFVAMVDGPDLLLNLFVLVRSFPRRTLMIERAALELGCFQQVSQRVLWPQ